MSDLTTTRDHARTMVKAGGPHVELWAQIADEIDDYLGRPTDAEDLFGETTAEPAHPTDLRDKVPGVAGTAGEAIEEAADV